MKQGERSIGAVVLLSGGQDSATCLAWATSTHGRGRVAAVSIDYGQRHRVELDAARDVADLFGVAEHRILSVGAFTELADSALTSEQAITAHGREDAIGGVLPTSFVPGRNLLFLTLAAAYAAKLGAPEVITGVCEADYSGYPDCRGVFVEAAERAIAEAFPTSCRVRLSAPLMRLTKADTVRWMQSLDREVPGAWRALGLTVTCYHGDRPGCGACPACVVRARGFAEAGIADPAQAWGPL